MLCCIYFNEQLLIIILFVLLTCHREPISAGEHTETDNVVDGKQHPECLHARQLASAAQALDISSQCMYERAGLRASNHCSAGLYQACRLCTRLERSIG